MDARDWADSHGDFGVEVDYIIKHCQVEIEQGLVRFTASAKVKIYETGYLDSYIVMITREVFNEDGDLIEESELDVFPDDIVEQVEKEIEEKYL
jgi:hypothetical protein